MKKGVLFITEKWNVGGIETYICNFSMHLINNQYDVCIHAWDENVNTPSAKINVAKVSKFSCNGVMRIFEIFYKQNLSLIRQLFKNKYSVIILNLSESAFYSLPTLLIFKLMNKQNKIFYHFHGSQYLEKIYSYKITSLKRLLMKKCEKIPYLISDKIISPSKYSKNEILIKEFGIHSQKIEIINPGRPILPKKNIIAKPDLGLNKKPLILCVSRLEKRKGNIEFIKITEVLDRILPQKCIKIVATTIEQDIFFSEEYFSQTTRDYKDSLVYYVNNPTKKLLASLYSAASIVIVPSVDLEIFGFVILEALTFGVPVAAYNIGAVSEIIQHKYNGFIQEVGNSTQLAQDIADYILNLKKYKNKMTKNAFRTVRQYSWTAYSNRIFEVMNSS